MSESSRHAYVVPVELKPHGNADSLSIVYIGGFQCVVNTSQWQGINKAFYLEPQTIVDVRRPEFTFLKREDKSRDKEVISARRLRGEWSLGLLIPAPEGWNIGDDGWEYLGLEHFEPEEEVEGLISGDCSKGPRHWNNLPKYDIENLKNYLSLFNNGELVCIQEKVDGCFKEDTPILMSDGSYKSISKIKPGDKIISYNETTGKFEEDMVEGSINSGKSDLVAWMELELDNGKSVTCTTNHKFLTKRGWVEARFLTEKDELV